MVVQETPLIPRGGVPRVDRGGVQTPDNKLNASITEVHCFFVRESCDLSNPSQLPPQQYKTSPTTAVVCRALQLNRY